MIKPVVFKTKNDNWYAYDNNTRFVVPINNINICNDDLDENNTLTNEHKIIDIKSNYKKYPLFENVDLENDRKELVDNCRNFLLQNGIRQLTLIVTEACNFRCKYCFYSEQYDYSRDHGNTMMKWEIAKAAIDYYFEFNKKVLKYNPNFKPTVGFYGGEPLLNWDLIKQSVEYIKKNYTHYFKKVSYTVTTNAYLLDNEKSEYLLSNGFSIAVSLDGNRYDHDRNRVAANGSLTYDTVLNNIKRLEKLYLQKIDNKEEVYPYTLLMTYDNDTSFVETINTALDMPKIFSKFGKINKVKSMGTEYYKNQRHEKYAYTDILNVVDSYVEGESKGTSIEKILFNQLTMFQSNNVNLVNNTTGGTCVPGEKMAVTHLGKFFICERIDYQSFIGDIYTGIDWELQKKYLSDFMNLKKDYCSGCNISNLCNLCFANCSCGNDEFFINVTHCEKYKKNISNLFGIYYTALENGQVIEK